MNYGRYDIIKEVGRGSMGVVYQAKDPNIDRIVAVKILRQDRVTNEEFVKRFVKEAKVIGRLSHSNIITIFDVGEDQGTVYIAMEYLEGVSLSELHRSERLSKDKVVDIAVQIAESLDYAHHKGVFHRDIKPSNIVIQPDGRIKITDFGIAHIEDASGTLMTQVGEIMGTPAYMSPEQVKGEHIDGRTDLFSLGVLLYELILGVRPFGGESKSLATTFNEILTLTPADPGTLSVEISASLAEIIKKALQKDPDHRFQTGKEMAEALRDCLKTSERAPMPAATAPAAPPAAVPLAVAPQTLAPPTSAPLAAVASAAVPQEPAPQEPAPKSAAPQTTVTPSPVPQTAAPKITGGKPRMFWFIGAILTIVTAIAVGGLFLSSRHQADLQHPVLKPELKVVAVPVATPKPTPPAVLSPSVPAAPMPATPVRSTPAPSKVEPPVEPKPAQPVQAKPAPPVQVKPSPLVQTKPAPVVQAKPAPPMEPKIASPVRAFVPVESKQATKAKNKAAIEKTKNKATALQATEKPKPPKEKSPVLPTVVTQPVAPGPAGGDLTPGMITSLPRFAFLKVRSVPKGAGVYIDGAFKGNTPLNIKIRLGEYALKLSKPGYQEENLKIMMDKMKDYPIDKNLKME